MYKVYVHLPEEGDCTDVIVFVLRENMYKVYTYQREDSVQIYFICSKGEQNMCTDGNTAFRCDSDKNSLVIIYMF